jgi:hypothetical protein
MKIFISYRRADTVDITGRIFDWLSSHFGDGSVFMDLTTIPVGADFRLYLKGWIRTCDVLIAIVGPRWLEEYTKRLTAPGPALGRDFPALEVEEAMAQGIPVIPVLVRDAVMPPPDSLAAGLQPFSYLNATKVESGRDFRAHVDRLIDAIEHVIDRTRAPEPDATSRPSLPTHVVVEPPAVARPTNLAFERPAMGGMPPGWSDGSPFVIGVSTGYQVRLRPRQGGGDAHVDLSRTSPEAGEFGSLMQRVPAHELAGKRLRVEVELRTTGLTDWAGLWLRIDSAERFLFFDNMHDRPITGDTPWTRYAIETDVPEGSTWLNYGVLLVGGGCVSIRRFSIVACGADGFWRPA